MANVVELFNNDIRRISTKFEFYIDGTQNEPLILSDDNFVMDSSVLEEASADGDTPLGAVSSNELQITLQNSDKRFSLNNTESPLYNKLVPGTKVVAKHCIESDDDTYEETVVGTFYTTAWKSDSGSIVASVTCHDRLYTLGELEIPTIPPKKNINLRNMIANIFSIVGIAPTSYHIDSDIDYRLDYVWYPKCKLKDFLQRLAVGYGCLIYVDRNDILQVHYAQSQKAAVTTISDSNQIITLSVPQEILSLYNRVELQYFRPQQSDRKVLLEMKDVVLQDGINELNKIAFTHTPVVRLDSITIEGGGEVQVVDWSHDSWEISLMLNNVASKLSKQPLTIKIIGYTIDQIEQRYVAQDRELLQRIGEKTLKITSEIIQHPSAARKYCEKLLSMVTHLDAVLEIECRGNSALGVGDIVHVQDDTNKLESDYVVYRNRLEHNGALTGHMKMTKVVNS